MRCNMDNLLINKGDNCGLYGTVIALTMVEIKRNGKLTI